MKNTYQKAVKAFEENNGMLRTAQAKRQGINERTIADMAAAGLLVRESYGLYRLSSLPPLQNPDLILVSARVPKAVINLASALYLHQLTTQIPHSVHIALLRGTKKPRFNYPPLHIVWLSPKYYQAGVETREMDGVEVRLYNKEKTVTDCFKFRSKIGKDVAIEALQDYLKSPEQDINKLLHFAKLNRVENIMRPYLEALL